MATNRDPSLDPDLIAHRNFATSFRGYDPHEVRRFLQQLAEAVRTDKHPDGEDREILQALAGERDELRRRVQQLERALASAENDDAVHVTSLITSETTQVIESARAAAAEIIRKAESEASRRRKEVKELEQRVDAEIQEKRSAAAEDTARIRREAMAEVTKLRNEADEETRSLRAKADEYATTTRSQAQEILRSRTAEAESFYETRMRKTEEATAAMRAEAEEEAATMRRNAEDGAAKMRREAEEETLSLRRRTDEEVKALRASAEAEAEDLRTAAQARVDELNVEADKIKAESENAANIARAEATAAADLATREVRDEARMMVAEAKAVREKILTDLIRRRRVARQQIDQARAARDRLLRSLEEVKRELDEATGELHRGVSEARSAMDRVPAPVADDDGEVAAALATLDRGRPERSRAFTDLGDTPETEDYARRLAGEPDHVAADAAPSGPAEQPDDDDAIERATEQEPPLESVEAIDDESSGTEADAADVEPEDGEEDASDGSGDDRRPSMFASSPPPPYLAPHEETSDVEDAEHDEMPDQAPAADADESEPDDIVVAEAAADESPRARLFDTAIGNTADPDAPPRSGGLFGLGTSNAGSQRTPLFERDEPARPASGDRAESEDLDSERTGTVERLTPDLKRQLKRALADDQSELLDAVRRGGRDASTDDLPAPERQVARFADALEASLRASANSGASAVDGRIWPGLVDPLVASSAGELVDDVRSVVSDAVARDGGEDRALETIRGHYREIRTNRLNRLVDSALTEAFDLGVEHGRKGS